MKKILEKLKIGADEQELAQEGLKMILEGIEGDIDVDLSAEQLAYIGLGSYLFCGYLLKTPYESYQQAPVAKKSGDGEIEIDVISIETLGGKKNVYGGDSINGPIDANAAEKWIVKVNKKMKREFEIYRDLNHRNTGKQSIHGEDFIVIKGKDDNGIWKAKDAYRQSNRLIMKAWGKTNERPKRHKLSEEEARKASARMNREISFDTETDTWNIVLQNDREDLILGWLVLWNQAI